MDQAKVAEQRASDNGCSESFTKFFSCLEDEGECKDDTFSSDGCEDEELALQTCGVSVFRSLCELAKEHQLNECQSGSFLPDGVECVGSVECQAKCVLLASCDTLSGLNSMGLTRFNECIGRC